ncbi:hypothetical protein PGIGA_G00089430 [Pangasianodon gigas]|uniref:Uncharacterized protein n=1 Tax=Pangasianodon gigas TaxID=30993 RepID=A0ACC5XBV8_PANGG|nr:hypothetical protein [Pangasianodon gigas]
MLSAPCTVVLSESKTRKNCQPGNKQYDHSNVFERRFFDRHDTGTRSGFLKTCTQVELKWSFKKQQQRRRRRC